MNKPLYRKIGIASIIMAISVISSRFIGLFREVAIAGIGGVGASVDAYQAAFSLAEILNHIAATGFLSITFIPIFSKCLFEGNEERGKDFFYLILNGFGVILLLFTAVCVYYTPSLVGILTPGLKGTPAFADAVRMTRIVLPAQLFFFMGGLFMAVQFSKEHFVIPALTPLIYNAAIIAGGLCLGPYIGMEGFAWGALVGAFLGAFVLQAISAYRLGIRYRFFLSFTHPVFKEYLKLSLPLMLGLTMTFSTEVFFRFFGSYMPEGSIGAINYALRLTLVLSAVLGQAIGTAAYPFMARLAAEQKIAELNSLLRDTLRLLTVSILLAAWVVLLRYEIVRIIFQRSAFTSQDTLRVGNLLGFMVFGAFAFSAQNLVSRGFYAMKNTLVPALLSTIMVLLTIPAYIWLPVHIGEKGIPLAMVFSSTVQVFVLYSYWCRKTHYPSKPVYWLIGKCALLSAILIVAIEPLQKKSLLYIGVGPWGFYKILLVSIFFVLFLLIGAKLFRIQEINTVFSRLRQLLKRSFSST